MKKIVSAILVALMLFASVPMGFAAESKTEVSEEIREKAHMLNVLGVSDIDVDKTVMNEGVSQKFFLKMIISAIFDSIDVEDDKTLKEVAIGLKIIKASDYNPNKLLQKKPAIDMALAALGYGIFDGYANAPGALLRQSLQSGVSIGGKYITASDAVTIICNMLDENLLYVYGISSSGYVMTKTTDNETILSHYKKISKLDGIVTDNGISNIYGESTIGIDKAYVNDYLIDCEAGQMRDYLGLRVEAYTIQNESSNAKLLYVREKDNKVIKIDDENIVNANLSQIKYEDEKSKEKKVSVSGTAKVIYNGEAYTSCTADDLKLKNGFLELIDNNDGGGIDIIKVTEYRTIVVKYLSLDEQKIVSELENATALNSVALDLDNNDKHRIVKDGIEIDLSEVALGDVLSVAQSKSGKVIDVFVSDKKFTGYIGKMTSKNRCLTIDGESLYYSKEFETSSAYDELYARTPKLGKEYVFYIDITGRIAAMKLADDTTILYGYLTGTNEDGVFDKEVQVKLYDSNGEWVIYKLRNKLRFNGVSGIKADAANDTLETKLNQLVQYKLDADGKIKEMNTPTETTDFDYDGYSCRPAEDLKYISFSNSFSNTIFIDDNSLMFFIPPVKTKEDMYFIGSTGDLIADRTYNVIAYNIDESGSSKCFVVNLKDDDLANQAMMFALVTNVGKKIDMNGDEVNTITCHIDKYSNEEIILGDDIDASTISQGDIMRLYLTPAGIAEKNEPLWSVADGEAINIPSVTDLRNQRAMAVTGKIKATYPDKALISLVNGTGIQSLRMRTGSRILVYYKDRNIVKDASLGELLPNDYAVLFSRSSGIANVVVIR